MLKHFALSAALLPACLLCGCATVGIRHVKADEFVRQARTLEGPNSACDTFFVGTSGRRAYIEHDGLYRVFRCHKTIVYWTELDGLPTDLADKLKAGEQPWTPWYKQAPAAAPVRKAE